MAHLDIGLNGRMPHSARFRAGFPINGPPVSELMNSRILQSGAHSGGGSAPFAVPPLTTQQHSITLDNDKQHHFYASSRDTGFADSDNINGDYANVNKSTKEKTPMCLIAELVRYNKFSGYKSCTLVAHDWGGIVAWNTVLLYPDLVDKLIVLNSPHPEALNEYLRGGSFKQMLKSWYMFFFQCPYLPELYFRCQDFQAFNNMLTNPKMGGCRNPKAFSEEDLEAWKYTFSQPNGLNAPLNYYRALLRLIGIPPVHQPIVQPPTLVIWGTEDLALEKAIGQLSVKYCRQGVIRFVDGSSHWVQEDEPELCTKYIQEFLTK